MPGACLTQNKTVYPFGLSFSNDMTKSMKHLQFDLSVISSFTSDYRIEAPNSNVTVTVMNATRENCSQDLVHYNYLHNIKVKTQGK